jgi:hypothetical protein
VSRQPRLETRTLSEAHAALVASRPALEADRSVWVTYYRRSSAEYERVAEIDRGHRGHAMYWAAREKAKAEQLTAQTGKRRARTGTGTSAPPASLDQAHEVLGKSRPSTEAGLAAWVTYHQRAAAVYAEVAEVDRAHHHEALFYASLARRDMAECAGGSPGFLSCQ